MNTFDAEQYWLDYYKENSIPNTQENGKYIPLAEFFIYVCLLEITNA